MKIIITMLLILLLSACAIKDKTLERFEKVNLKKIVDRESPSGTSYSLLDTIVFGYMGNKDSLSVYFDERLVFSGLTNYKEKIGIGDQLFKIAKNSKEYIHLKIIFHHKNKFIRTPLKNEFNTLLIHNNLNYFEGLIDYEEDIDLYPYMSPQRYR